MGCFMDKQSSSSIVFKDTRDNQQNTIRITKHDQHHASQSHIQKPQDLQINLILSPVQVQLTDRKPQLILEDIVKLSQRCIHYYNEHQIDIAHQMLVKIQKDLKQLEQRGFQIQMNQHFKQQFIELSHILAAEYQDMIDFNNQVLKGGWKIQKKKKNFVVKSRIQGQTVGILLESVLEVPFENFIAVMIQPDLYKQFLPFIESSKQLKQVRRNCKLGFIQMSFPIISNRQSYFQGVLYNRLNNQKPQDRQLFMYTRSIQNRKDLQSLFNFEVQLNPKCIPFEYKYVLLKYVPLSQTAGKMIMGMNIDLKLNALPLSILQMISISFSQDFFDNIVKISKKFQGSAWDLGIKKNPQLFNFTKKVRNQFLQKQRL